MRAIALVLLATLASFAAPRSAIAQSSLTELTFALVAGLNSGNVQGAMLKRTLRLGGRSRLVVKALRAVHRGMQYGYAHKAESVAALVASAHIDPAISARAWDIDFGKWKA
jgi:hypothetical protein